MADVCAICGETDTLLFTCTLCQSVHCTTHRLPENHGCYGLDSVVTRFAGYDPANDELIVYEGSKSTIGESETDADEGTGITDDRRRDVQDQPENGGGIDRDRVRDHYDRLVEVSTLLDDDTSRSPEVPGISSEDFVIEHEEGTDPATEIEQSKQIEYLTYGTKDPEFESGPDVAEDGSAVYQDDRVSTPTERHGSSDLRSRVRSKVTTRKNTALRITHTVMFSLAVFGAVLLVAVPLLGFYDPDLIPDTLSAHWVLGAPAGNVTLIVVGLAGWWLSVRARQAGI